MLVHFILSFKIFVSTAKAIKMHIRNNKILEKVRVGGTPSTSGQDYEKRCFQCDERKADCWQRSKGISGSSGRRCRSSKADVFYFLVKIGARSLAKSKGSDYINVR